MPIDLLAQSAALFCPYPLREFVVYENTTPSSFACHPSTGGELSARTVFVDLVVMQNTTPSSFACHPSTGEELSVRTVFVDLVVMQNTTPSSFACHPSTGGELPGADTIQPPRQAAPPGTDAMRL